MTSNHNRDSIEWHAIEQYIRDNALSTNALRSLDEKLTLTREEFLLSNGILAERVSGLGVKFDVLSHDVDKSMSNHRQDNNKVKQDLADIRLELANDYPTWSQMTKVVVGGTTLTILIIGIMLWLFTTFQTQDHKKAVQSAVTESNTVLIQDLLKELRK